MDSFGPRFIVILGGIVLAGLAILAGPLIASLGARWRACRNFAARAAVGVRRTVEEDDARERTLQFRQMLWRSLL